MHDFTDLSDLEHFIEDNIFLLSGETESYIRRNFKPSPSFLRNFEDEIFDLLDQFAEVEAYYESMSLENDYNATYAKPVLNIFRAIIEERLVYP